MWGSHMKTKQCLDGNVGMCLALGFTWGLALLCPHIIITIIIIFFLFSFFLLFFKEKLFVFVFIFSKTEKENKRYAFLNHISLS